MIRLKKENNILLHLSIVLIVLHLFACKQKAVDELGIKKESVNASFDFLKQERDKYEEIIKKLAEVNLQIITKDKISNEDNKLPFNPDYRQNTVKDYQYYPYIKYSISKIENHIAFSCLNPDNKKHYFIVLKEANNNNYSLIFLKDYDGYEFFILLYKQRDKNYVQLQFEANTDNAEFYQWDGKSYVHQNWFN